MPSQTAQSRLGLNADEELDPILGAIDAEMALAITPPFLGWGQCHDNAPRRGVKRHGYTVTIFRARAISPGESSNISW